MTIFHWLLLGRDGFKYGCGLDPAPAVSNAIDYWLHSDGPYSKFVERFGTESPVTIAIMLPDSHRASIRQFIGVKRNSLYVRPFIRDARPLRGRTYIGWVSTVDHRNGDDDVSIALRNGMTTMQHLIMCICNNSEAGHV